MFCSEYNGGAYQSVLHPMNMLSSPRLIDKSILKQENNWSENVEIEPRERPCIT